MTTNISFSIPNTNKFATLNSLAHQIKKNYPECTKGVQYENTQSMLYDLTMSCNYVECASQLKGFMAKAVLMASKAESGSREKKEACTLFMAAFDIYRNI